MEILNNFFRPVSILNKYRHGNGHRYGNGYGNGHGQGYGNGYGHGNGHGNGDGDGDGDGHGDGNGYGNGNGHGHGNSHGHGNGHGHGYGYGNGHGYGNRYGCGHGHGNGRGHGYGNGDGHGNGYGDGNGDGDGNGYGHGNGDGILFINKQKVHLIDNIQTIITIIKEDIAKGYILQADLTLKECYVVRNNHYFAHGDTLKKAIESLEEKTLYNCPLEYRILNFKNKFKNFNLKQKASLLYDWHFKLTGSCKFGRDLFCKEHNINLTKDKFTIWEFIKLTENSYNGHIIKQLKN